MEWARLILDYVDALAWPLVVVILVILFVILFKQNIGRLIDRIRSVSGPGGSRMDFGGEVLELVEQASESELSRVSLIKTEQRITDIIAGADIDKSLQREIRENIRSAEANIEHRPDNNYRGVILDSWAEVEHKLIGVADALDLGLGPNPGVAPVINELEARDLIEAETADIFRSARELRNEAAHELDPLISEQIARKYAGLTSQISTMLRLIEMSNK